MARFTDLIFGVLQMKKLFLLSALAIPTLCIPPSWAEETHHSDKDKKPATAMTEKDKQLQMGKMQESMLRMHEQMHKIMDTKNPQEREKLMQEHAKMMQDMHMMQGKMGSHGKMGDAKGHGKVSSDAKGSKMDGGKMDGAKMDGDKMDGMKGM